jgi:hypothetical protein
MIGLLIVIVVLNSIRSNPSEPLTVQRHTEMIFSICVNLRDSVSSNPELYHGRRRCFIVLVYFLRKSMMKLNTCDINRYIEAVFLQYIAAIHQELAAMYPKITNSSQNSEHIISAVAGCSLR